MKTLFLLLALPLTIVAQADLPAGPGKTLVETSCVQCHDTRRIASAGHSPEEWRNVVGMMVNAGARLTPSQAATVTEYLAKNFPPHAAHASIVASANVQVTIKEWAVPTIGSRPHDPLAARDGSIWYSGQMANVLGRLDPSTGKIKEYRLPPDSGPHGLVEDRDGNIWYTANFGGYIGKLDPRTGKVREYRLPDPAARDPHTPLFDRNGVLWFTVQSGNMVGRLDPQTGAIKLVTLPEPRSQPYGMVIDSKGVPFFAEFGANRIAKIDPQTLQLHEYPLPDPQARPRRIAIMPDDSIWYSDYARGYLGRLDASSGAVREWLSPSGARSQPYAIAYTDGAIWYSESGVNPNTLVRFDPKTERFASWPIPSGGGVVRNMMPTPDGNLALACSGVNRVGLATIAEK